MNRFSPREEYGDQINLVPTKGYTQGHLGIPRCKKKKQLDNILVDRRHTTSITNVRMYGGANYVSGHYLVKGMYRARIQTSKQQYRKEREKINLVQL